MSKTVDQRIVEMSFNNKNFEKNVSKTMDTLGKLKSALKLEDAGKGLADLQSKMNTVKFHGLANTIDNIANKFSGLKTVGTMAMLSISQSAANAGINLVKSLSTDNIIAGWNKLQQKANSVSTLISQGYETDVVEKQISKLNWFSDETSYNFTDMIDNIAKFTASGQSLEASTTAMQGIALWAAKSGQNAQKASSAMYQLSQALSAGVMRKEDWKSIQNVSMDTAEFRQVALDTAVALGTLKKVGNDTYQSLRGNKGQFTKQQFAENLTEGQWFTSDVMMKVYQEYAKGADQINDIITKMDTNHGLNLIASDIIDAYDSLKGANKDGSTFDDFLKDNGIDGEAAEELKKMVATIDDFGIKAFKAGQEYRTFNDVIDATKDAVSTKWMGIFETILGNIDQQKELWSTIGDAFYEAFAEPLNSLQSMLTKWVGLGGREDLFAGLGNIVAGINSIIDPIKEAFRDVFPPMTAERLAKITKAFADFTSKCKLGEKTMERLKATFTGVFKVIDAILSFIGKLAKGVFKLAGNFTGVIDGVIFLTGALGDWLSKVSDSIAKTDLFGLTLEKTFEFLQNGIDKFKAFAKEIFKFDTVLNVLRGIWTFVSKIGQGIGKAFADAFRGGDIKSVLDIFNSGLISGILINFVKFTKNLSGTFENIGEVLENVKGILEAYQQDLKAKVLIKIATAIGILAGSILVLSLINPERLGAALSAMAFLIAELMLSLTAFTKLAPNVKNVFRTASALTAIASSLLILSAAMKVMSTIEWQDMLVALGGIGVGVQILVAAVKHLPEADVIKASKSIKKLSGALLIYAVALKIMSTIGWEQMLSSVLGVVAGLGMMGIVVNALPKNTKSRVAGLMGMATALVIFAGALKILSSMNWIELGTGLAALGFALTEMTVAMNFMPKGAKSKGLGLIAMATALVIFASAIEKIGNMHWTEVAQGLITMGIALTAITIAMRKLPTVSMLANSGALVAMATSLVILGAALKVIGSTSIDTLIKGLGGLAVAFIIFGVAAKVLAPLAPSLLAIAGSFALFGAATLGVGIGLGLIATGLTAVSVALAGGSTAIVAGLTAIVLGIVGLVPEIIKTLGDAIVLICRVIIECAPLIADTVLIVVSEILKSLANHGPQIVDSLMKFLIGILGSIKDNLPALIVAGVEVIAAFFQGILDAMGKIDPTSLLKGLSAVGVLTVMLYAIAGLTSILPSAIVGIIGMGVLITELIAILSMVGGLAQTPGLSWLISEGGNFLQVIGTAIGKFIGGIVGGIAAGATSTLPQVGENLSKFMTNVKGFIDGVKSVDSSVITGVLALSGAMLALTGANLISSIASFLTVGSSFAGLGHQLTAFMINAMPFITLSRQVDATAMKGVKCLAEALMILTGAKLLDGIASFLTGGSSLSDFGSQLGGLGTHLNEFVTNLGTFDDSKVTTIDCAGRALKALASAAKEIPNEGGWAAKILGENSIATFGQYLPGLATNLNGFMTNLGTFDDSKVTTVDCAGRAIVALAKAADELPNEGGWAAAILGDNSIAKFADKLPKLGTNMSQFINNLGSFDDSKVGAVGCVGKAISALAEAATKIPNEGGLWAKIVGDNSLASFGEKLPGLAKNLTKFVTNLGTFTEAQVVTVNSACKALNAIAKLGEINIKSTGKNLSTFGENVIGFATKLKSFITSMNKISSDSIDAAIYKTDSLIKMATTIAGTNVKSLSTFGDSLKKVAKDGVKGFVKEFSGKNPKADAVSAIKTLIDALIDGADDKKSSVKKQFKKISEAGIDALDSDARLEDARVAGKNVVKGFANGINNNIGLVTSAGTALGKAALDAAKAALDEHSPSKEAYKVGSYFGEGLVIGIDDYGSKAYKAGYNIADHAKSGLNKAIAYVSDIFSNGMDTQPTIRPILDLSDIKSGANDINSMFSDNASIGVMSNLNAISSGMSGRLQNGSNLEVVAAINRLRKDLGNVGGTVNNYNSINGVTYDGESSVADAVRTIVRAATVERRT